MTGAPSDTETERRDDPSAGPSRSGAGRADTGRAEAGRERLSSLPTAPRLTTAEAAAHSALVRRLRLILPVVALVLIAVFVLNARKDGPENVFLDEFKDIDATADELRMADPRFSGVDDAGAPYDITADAAIQAPGDDKRIRLERPRAVTGQGDTQSVLTAEAGAFDSEQNVLQLNDAVRFEHRIGAETYVLNAPSATFSIDAEEVVSDAGVEGEGPRGATLQADRMVADNKSRKVVFEGNVKMRIYPDRERAASSPRADEEDAGDGSAEGKAPDAPAPKPDIRED